MARPASNLRLALADGTPREAFARVARALDSKRITIREARQIGDLLKIRVLVADAEEFARRLAAAEQKVLEDTRSRQLPAPAGSFEILYPPRAAVTRPSPERAEPAPGAAFADPDSDGEPVKS